MDVRAGGTGVPEVAMNQLVVVKLKGVHESSFSQGPECAVRDP
jgi:hypothetical protein